MACMGLKKVEPGEHGDGPVIFGHSFMVPYKSFSTVIYCLGRGGRWFAYILDVIYGMTI